MQRDNLLTYRTTWSTRQGSNLHFHPLAVSWFVARGLTCAMLWALSDGLSDDLAERLGRRSVPCS